MNVVKASLIHKTIEPVATIHELILLEKVATINAKKIEKKIRKKAARKIYRLYRKAQTKAKETLEIHTATAINTFFYDLKKLQTEHNKTLEYKTLELALSIAESVLMAEVQTNLDSLKQRYTQLAQKLKATNECTVLVHPDLAEQLQSVVTLPVKTCPNVPRGEIAIKTNSGMVQTDFRQHFDIVQGLILSGENHQCNEGEQTTCN